MVSLSVITVVKDNADGLRRTIESALSQDGADWELIIVYGQCQDATLEVAMKFASEDPRISILKQIDQGIYEAMNLGVSKALGNFIWFMNSGDQFYSRTSLSSGLSASMQSQAGFVIGGYKIEDDQRLFKQRPGNLNQITFALSRRGACHQAMIFRRELVQGAGNFDTNFKLAADYKLCLKLIAEFRARKIPEILALMEPNGLSDRNLKTMHIEKARIRKEIFARNLPIIFLGWGWMKAARLKTSLRKSLIGKKHPLR